MPDLQMAAAWLTRHGLDGFRPTPALAKRLRARQIVQFIDSLMLAGLIVAAALVRVSQVAGDFRGSRDRWPLLALGLVVLGIALARWLLDGWVRRVDRRAAAGLVRRATHAVPPGWREMLGVPYAVFAAATVAGALALAVSALAFDYAGVRDAAVVLLIGLFGVVAGAAVQIRHLLTRPVVADDEESLTADLVMRIEDGRAANALSVVMSLPVLVLFGFAPGWWNAASLFLVIAGTVALVVISARTPRVGALARRAMAATR